MKILGVDDARMHFDEQRTPIALCGHTHYPGVWIEESPAGRIRQRLGEGVVTLPASGKVLVNVGSVGQPRDGDPRSRYVIFRPDTNAVEFRRVAYDIQQTRKKNPARESSPLHRRPAFGGAVTVRKSPAPVSRKIQRNFQCKIWL